MVIVLILAATLGIIYSVLLGSQETYSNGSKVAHLQERARIAVDAMANELRQTGASKVTTALYNGSTAITFQTNSGFSGGAVQWSTPIVYRFELESGELQNGKDDNKNGLVDEGRVVRIQDGKSVTITDDVMFSGLSFNLVGNNLEIMLIMIGRDLKGRSISSKVDTSVSLRN